MAKRTNWAKVRDAERMKRPTSEDRRLEARATAYLAAVDRREAERPPPAKRKPGKSHKRARYRILQSLDGPVRYVDSGWTEEEWAAIEKAVGRMGRPR